MLKEKRETQERVPVTFLLSGELFNKLRERLPDYGEVSKFYRVVTEQFLEGKLEVFSPEEKF